MKEKGRGKVENEQNWVVEMNDSSLLCLIAHGRADMIHQLIEKCNFWKCWHAAKRRMDALTKACEAFGIANIELSKNEAMDLAEFCDRLSLQGLDCNPKEVKHPVDCYFQCDTKLAKKQKQGQQGCKLQVGAFLTEAVGSLSKEQKHQTLFLMNHTKKQGRRSALQADCVGILSHIPIKECVLFSHSSSDASS